MPQIYAAWAKGAIDAHIKAIRSALVSGSRALKRSRHSDAATSLEAVAPFPATTAAEGGPTVERASFASRFANGHWRVAAKCLSSTKKSGGRETS
jgi:hypothetical protein